MDSFPQLAGTVLQLLRQGAAGRAQLSEPIHAGERWGELLGMTDVVLNPAACYPVYPTSTGTLPEAGRLVTMMNWVFRHEPSPEPTRMQSFRVREFVRAGTPDEVVELARHVAASAASSLLEVARPAGHAPTSPPIRSSARGGKMLAAGQKEQKLKFEVLIPVISDGEPDRGLLVQLPPGSLRRGRSGSATADGEVAHTACLGFGLERVVMALFKTHGFEPERVAERGPRKLWP